MQELRGNHPELTAAVEALAARSAITFQPGNKLQAKALAFHARFHARPHG